MKKAVILHGTIGSPDGNWFRWLERELTAAGLTVWLPQLPHADKPSLAEWLDFVQQNAPFSIDRDSLIVGHSSGATLALLLAQDVGAVVAVAPFVPMSEVYSATAWEANARLFDGFETEKILRSAQNDSNKLVVYSDDDPYIPIDVFERIVEIAGAERLLLPSQGHFNLEKSEEYKEFSELKDVLLARELL